MMWSALLPVAILTALLGCAHHRVNPALDVWEPHRTVLDMGTSDRSREVVVMLAFSGGGTRAAAMAYGALEELRDTRLALADGSERRMLDEIDLISSVSGGSFTAAYYGLFGDRIFDDFEQRFLRRDVQGVLVRKLFNPLNWLRLSSVNYARSDLAADFYDEDIFDGKTILDYGRVPGPGIVINATDVTRGSRFAFIREVFDPLCNDLIQYRVARAVAASSAVPGLMSPIRVQSYAGSCGYERPSWVNEELEKYEPNSRRWLEAKVMDSYEAEGARERVHLVDGGVTDNLGVRAFFDTVVGVGSMQDVLEAGGRPNARAFVLIVVNAQAQPELQVGGVGFFSSLSLMAGVTSGIQIRRINYETLELVRNRFELWSRELESRGHPFEYHQVEVSFAQVENLAERTRLNNLPTSLRLSDEDVDLLRESARRLLRESEPFARARESIIEAIDSAE
jgi:NTE family protein